MNVKVIGSNVVVTTVVSLEELKEISQRKPSALVLTEEIDHKMREVFRVGVGEGSLNGRGAYFNGNTNTDPKCAMLTIDISGKPEEIDVKRYIADMYGAAILQLQKVEEQFLPALEAIASEQATLSEMISVEL